MFCAPVLPLSLYIHLPWCVQKCPYCDFNSHTLRTHLPEQIYLQSLLADLDQDLVHVQNRQIISIFFGGGTPSLFSAEAITFLLNEISQRLTLSDDCEITLEANPGTVEQDRFHGFYAAGVNRISLGVQSFDDHKLKALGRIHNGGSAQKAIQTAINAGFKQINVDLMYGLPHQSTDEALVDIQIAASFKPTHLSWYQLTLEPNTPFYHKPPPLPDDEALWQIQEQGQQLLSQLGFLPYEVSAYSQKGTQCRHNRNYWEFGDYLGIGAGAHSKITNLSHQTVTRFWKVKHPKAYLDTSASFIAETNPVSPQALPFEFMLNALRLYEPVSKQLFMQRTGLSLDTISQPIEQAVEKGLLKMSRDHFEVTPMGRRFLNDLVGLFLG